MKRGPLERSSSAGAGGHARAAHLDAVRGLAVVLMVVDHLALYAGADAVRVTLGRVALPLFFVLAGHLVRRLSWRLAGVGALGLVLPWFAPWVDRPNVLLWYALGAGLLVGARRLGVAPLWMAVPGMTLGANGWAELVGAGYHPALLLAMLAVGASLDREAFRWARRLPGALALVGRWPVSLYAGHVLAFTALWGLPG